MPHALADRGEQRVIVVRGALREVAHVVVREHSRVSLVAREIGECRWHEEETKE